MNTKNSIKLGFYIILLLITPLNAVINIKPEEFVDDDMIFANNEPNQFFYAAGYFTSNNIDPYLRNQGYSLSHDSSVFLFLIMYSVQEKRYQILMEVQL